MVRLIDLIPLWSSSVFYSCPSCAFLRLCVCFATALVSSFLPLLSLLACIYKLCLPYRTDTHTNQHRIGTGAAATLSLEAQVEAILSGSLVSSRFPFFSLPY